MTDTAACEHVTCPLDHCERYQPFEQFVTIDTTGFYSEAEIRSARDDIYTDMPGHYIDGLIKALRAQRETR